ncbi:hypothetical protein QVD17_25911 [Tagetes erecta]|uniref:Uncharacterized protein n=1 Tax=Tagetes erecta TaxID=13708 RepID=A0AAD8NPK8_TARER|nr:hypothetical protein QVD17_25911 [Tagetes erecta]
MAGLQRSSISFRRQGSSGLIWDDNFLSSSQSKPPSSNADPLVENTNIRSINTVRRNRSKDRECAATTEPPSPTVPVCGLCRGFGCKADISVLLMQKVARCKREKRDMKTKKHDPPAT